MEIIMVNRIFITISILCTLPCMISASFLKHQAPSASQAPASQRSRVQMPIPDANYQHFANPFLVDHKKNDELQATIQRRAQLLHQTNAILERAVEAQKQQPKTFTHEQRCIQERLAIATALLAILQPYNDKSPLIQQLKELLQKTR